MFDIEEGCPLEGHDVLVWESMVDPDLDDIAPETPGQIVAQLAKEAPGWASVAELAALAPERLGADDAVTYVQAVSRAAAWLDSLCQRALVVAAGTREQVLVVAATPGRPALSVTDPAREELAAALGLAPSTAQGRIHAARVLHRFLPATAAALCLGRITAMHARVIAETLTGHGLGVVVDLDDIDAAQAAEFETRVLPTAERAPVGQTRTRARRVFRSLDPASGAARVRRARAARDVLVRHEPDGVSLLTARLAADDAHRIAAAVDALARDYAFADSLDDPDAGLVGVRRAAALASLVSSGRAAVLPASSAVEMHLVVDLPTLTGLRDTPVEVLEGGVVPAEVARHLALDARFRRLVTDPDTGHLLDLGRRSYAIPDALRDFLVARDGTCRHPGCSRPAARCQLDHAVPWGEGGATAPSNLEHLCVRHHQLKTHAGWTVATADDGSCEWTSPQRRKHRTDPAVLTELPPPPSAPPRVPPPDDCAPPF